MSPTTRSFRVERAWEALGLHWNGAEDHPDLDPERLSIPDRASELLLMKLASDELIREIRAVFPHEIERSNRSIVMDAVPEEECWVWILGKTVVVGEKECWVAKGTIRNGFPWGDAEEPYRRRRVRRRNPVTLELMNGEVPYVRMALKVRGYGHVLKYISCKSGEKRYDVSHLCGHTHCYRPSHLVVETHVANLERQGCLGYGVDAEGKPWNRCEHGSSKEERCFGHTSCPASCPVRQNILQCAEHKLNKVEATNNGRRAKPGSTPQRAKRRATAETVQRTGRQGEVNKVQAGTRRQTRLDLKHNATAAQRKRRTASEAQLKQTSRRALEPR